MVKLNASQLRVIKKSQNQNSKSKLARVGIYVILDNVLDTYNIGSIFRLADALSIRKIYLCGGSETPPNSRIKKASINTTEIVDWEYRENPLDAIRDVKKINKNIQIVAIEQSNRSVPYNRFRYTPPICLIVGNETEGISAEILELCNEVVELPMLGVNISLNVVVSLAVVLYKVIEEQ